MSPVVATQILACLREIRIDRNKINTLQENSRYMRLKNSRYMRQKLKKLGFQLLGDKASPIIPILIFNPGKWLNFHELVCYKDWP